MRNSDNVCICAREHPLSVSWEHVPSVMRGCPQRCRPRPQGYREAHTIRAEVVSQRDQLLAIDRIHEPAVFQALSAAEASVFQIAIADLQAFTGLDFGNLRQADTHTPTTSGARPIRSRDGIRF
jgi:hypothetical protein